MATLVLNLEIGCSNLNDVISTGLTLGIRPGTFTVNEFGLELPRIVTSFLLFYLRLLSLTPTLTQPCVLAPQITFPTTPLVSPSLLRSTKPIQNWGKMNIHIKLHVRR